MRWHAACFFVSQLVLFMAGSAAAFPICLIQTPGFVDCCSASGTDSRGESCNPAISSSTYSGLSVAIVRYVANTSGWAEVFLNGTSLASLTDSTTAGGTSFYFVCTNMTAPESMAFLAQNDTVNQCSMAVGALTISADRLRSGIEFRLAHRPDLA